MLTAIADPISYEIRKTLGGTHMDPIARSTVAIL
jgi:hypothetical protein